MVISNILSKRNSDGFFLASEAPSTSLSVRVTPTSQLDGVRPGARRLSPATRDSVVVSGPEPFERRERLEPLDHLEPLERAQFRSSNHPIRPRQNIRWNCQANLLGCLQIDHQLELRWLLHREIGWFYAFENLIHVGCCAVIKIGDAG